MQIDRLAMNSMLISQCRICKQEDFRKCASVVRGILAPFPDRESLNDKGKDLCPVCQQIIDIQYAYCFDCKDRKLGALSSLDFIGYHSPPDPFNLIKGVAIWLSLGFSPSRCSRCRPTTAKWKLREANHYLCPITSQDPQDGSRGPYTPPGKSVESPRDSNPIRFGWQHYRKYPKWV